MRDASDPMGEKFLPKRMPEFTLAPIRSPEVEKKSAAIPFDRFFSSVGRHPFDEVEWDRRDVKLFGMNGIVDEAKSLEFPVFWTQNASNIAGSKYFRGRIGTSERETSVRQMIGRVVRTMREWGLSFGYFDTAEDADVFADELTHILLYQKAAFNSPVWFNVGIEAKPQCSACFLLAVEDTMRSILDWIYTEGLVFKGGSGSGINLSNLRSSRETLSAGGRASGPVSFMRGADSVAGSIASGGSTRRAAKMVVLNIDHPDILEFIRCKSEEEKKIRALMAAGYDMADLNNDAWKSIQYQNANNSVRVTDEFMRAAERDGMWQTRFVTTGEVADEYKARELLKEIAQAAWVSGDPGMQYDDEVQRWHTCPNSGRITTTNPCGEYVHLDNSACNLASMNLLKFLRDDGTFAVEEYRHAVRTMILAQDIIVSGSSYPTEKIGENARAYRELGLGYANLGALLMSIGIPYDSEVGQTTASAITALMTGEAYRYSADIARRMGPFAGYTKNREPMLRVIVQHRAALDRVKRERTFDTEIYDAARTAWDDALQAGYAYGYRNSQVTVIAPTGTIALMMDCATTGIEPEFALVKTKNLVGGGTMRFVNSTVEQSLKFLGYNEQEIHDIAAHTETNATIEGAPHLKEEHLAVFDCAVRPAKGTRSISWQGHVKMVAAVQPFVSGGISKTFNMPHETTVGEIIEAYVMAWKLGIKAFAVYRDGSKAAQPLVTSGSKKSETPQQGNLQLSPARRHLPATRASETHKFSIAGHEGYLTYSIHPDDGLAEIFIRMAKQGSTLAGLLDAFAITVSLALQYGVPLKDLARKFIYGRFEPAGFTANPDIQVATSITDYIFRYLALRFLTPEELADLGINGHAAPSISEPVSASREVPKIEPTKATIYADSVCRSCGGMLIQTGSCKTCLQCGGTTGGC